MRYIGNKTRLLGFIGDAIADRGIGPGTAVDPFCGTASVATELKRRGFRVLASDIMAYGYVFARAYVQASHVPRLDALLEHLDAAGDATRTHRTGARAASDDLEFLTDWLNRLPPRPGFVHDHYTPAGPQARRHGRMYFTPENGGRIDAVRSALEEWRGDGRLDEDSFHLLLAALLEAMDRVANTTGVYAAFVKSWQPNALRPLELRTSPIVPGNGCLAAQGDALVLSADLEPFDLLYLDPPYNTRQYAGYYHIPEIVAVGWFDGKVRTRGKTGLIEDDDKRSDWSRRQRCESAFEALVASAPWRHLVMSYNAEGIIPERTIRRVLTECGRASTYERRALTYKRYRSDADGANRRYRGDTVTEYLYCVDR